MFDMSLYRQLRDHYAKTDSSNALYQLRKFLDYNGCSMPPTKYDYKDNDICTWKYLDGKVSYNEGKKSYNYVNILNPKFKYGHLV